MDEPIYPPPSADAIEIRKELKLYLSSFFSETCYEKKGFLEHFSLSFKKSEVEKLVPLTTIVTHLKKVKGWFALFGSAYYDEDKDIKEFQKKLQPHFSSLCFFVTLIHWSAMENEALVTPYVYRGHSDQVVVEQEWFFLLLTETLSVWAQLLKDTTSQPGQKDLDYLILLLSFWSLFLDSQLPLLRKLFSCHYFWRPFLSLSSLVAKLEQSKRKEWKQLRKGFLLLKEMVQHESVALETCYPFLTFTQAEKVIRVHNVSRCNLFSTDETFQGVVVFFHGCSLPCLIQLCCDSEVEEKWLQTLIRLLGEQKVCVNKEQNPQKQLVFPYDYTQKPWPRYYLPYWQELFSQINSSQEFSRNSRKNSKSKKFSELPVYRKKRSRSSERRKPKSNWKSSTRPYSFSRPYRRSSRKFKSSTRQEPFERHRELGYTSIFGHPDPDLLQPFCNSWN